MASILQRLTAWLCSAVALVSALTPAQGFVVCLEPDGCVSIEIAAPADACGGCGDHQDQAEPIAAARAASDIGCPCLDLPIPGSSQECRPRPEPVELRAGSWCAGPLPSFSRAPVPPPQSAWHARLAAPRPSGSLELIQSVVLQV